MKKLQRLVALLVVITMVWGMAGCGSKTNNKEGNDAVKDTSAEVTDDADTTTDTVDEELGYGGVSILKDENGNIYDLGGMEIIVADWWSSGEETEAETAQEEATAEYRKWIQETYNFKIKQVAVGDWGTHPEEFINFATTGGEENYVYILRQGSLAAPLKSGLFYNLSTLDSLNFEDDKWVVEIKELLTKDGGIYGMRAEDPEPNGGIYFNKRMLEEAGVEPESLYDMQADGTWTWEAFEEICKKVTRDTDNDGVIDVYAMTNFSINFFSEALASNNACYIGRDADGNYYNATQSDECLEALNWANDMVKKYEMPVPDGAEWDYSFSSFKNGEAAMNAGAVYEASGMQEAMKDDYGFVCFPKGPNAEQYYNIWADNVSVIPACYDEDRAWKIAFGYNLFTQPTPGYDGEEDWKTGYYENYRDTRAVDETIALLKQNGVIWYDSLVPGLIAGDILYEVYAGVATPAEKVEGIANQWQAYIEEANK